MQCSCNAAREEVGSKWKLQPIGPAVWHVRCRPLYGSATWHSPPTWKSACGWVAAWSQKLALAPAAGDAVAPGTLFGQVSASVSRPGAGTPDHGWPPRRHRPQAGTAIRWPRATPPRIPSRGRRNTGVPAPKMCRQRLRRPTPCRPAAPGPTARCVCRRAAREAPFRNERRSANAGDAEVDA